MYSPSRPKKLVKIENECAIAWLAVEFVGNAKRPAGMTKNSLFLQRKNLLSKCYVMHYNVNKSIYVFICNYHLVI